MWLCLTHGDPATYQLLQSPSQAAVPPCPKSSVIIPTPHEEHHQWTEGQQQLHQLVRSALRSLSGLTSSPVS